MNSCLRLDINDDCIKSFNTLKLRKTLNYIVFKISEGWDSIVIESSGDSTHTHQQLLDSLPENEPRYLVMNYDFDKGLDGKRSKTVCIFWCPIAASVKSRMIYASARANIKNALEGIQVSIQAANVDNISEDEILLACTKASR